LRHARFAGAAPLDINLVPREPRKKLLIARHGFDHHQLRMLDELADMAGLKAKSR